MHEIENITDDCRAWTGNGKLGGGDSMSEYMVGDQIRRNTSGGGKMRVLVAAAAGLQQSRYVFQQSRYDSMIWRLLYPKNRLM
jgi:hypothetical protein